MRDILADLLEEQEEAVQRETALPEEERPAAGGYLPPLVEKSVGRSPVETQADFSVERGIDKRETAAPVETPKEGEQDGSETQRNQLSQPDWIENSKPFDLGAEWEGRIPAETEPFSIGKGQAQGDGQVPIPASVWGAAENWTERILKILPGGTAALSVKKSGSESEGAVPQKAPVPTVDPSGENASLVDRGQAQGDEQASIPASARGVAESWAERILKILPGGTAALSVKKSGSESEGAAPKRTPVPTVEPRGENASPAETIDEVFTQAKGYETQTERRVWSSGTLYSTLRRWERAASWPESVGRSASVPLPGAVSQSSGTGGFTMEQLDRAAQRDARRFDAPFPLY